MIKNVKLDARSLKTRSKIRKAVVVCLKTTAPEDIKVTKITALSKISRNSFYTHYSSVNDVLDDIFFEVESVFANIFNKIDINDFLKNPYPYLKEIFAPLNETPAFSEFIIFSKFSTVFMQRLIDSLTDKFISIYSLQKSEMPQSIPYLINFAVSGIFHFVYKWYKDGKKAPFDEILLKISILIKNTISMISEVKTKI
jgi:AcrR family transcriptional regulator